MTKNHLKTPLFFIKKLITYQLFIVMFFGLFTLNAWAADVPLEINQISVNSTDKTATITWRTNRNAMGKVEYGTASDNYRWSLSTNLNRSEQAITIFGLTAETTYYFRITAFDNTSEAVSFEQNFKTGKGTDNTAPVISKVVAIYVTGTTATIQWETNEPATTEVEYGRTENYGNSKTSNSKVRVHDITIKGLNPASTYHYRVKSKDADNNITRWQDLTFQTLPTESAEDDTLRVYNIEPSSQNDINVKATSAVISWWTNKLAEGWVRYGTSTRYSKTIATDPPRDFSQSITLFDLKPNTTYYFEIEARDVFGARIKSSGQSFTTKGDGSTTVVNIDDMSPGGQILGSTYAQEYPKFYASYDNDFTADMAAGSLGVTRVGSTELITGRFNRAAKINLESHLQYSGKDNFDIKKGTVSFWFKPNWNSNDNKNHILFDLNPPYTGAASKYFTIAKITNDDQGIKNELAFGLEDSRDNDYWVYLDNVEFSSNQWYFVAVTWQYNGGGYKIYINGESPNTNYAFNKKQQEVNLKESPALGNQFYVGSNGGIKENVGADSAIDDLVIFGQPLDDDQIYQLYIEGARSFINKIVVDGVGGSPLDNGNDSQGNGQVLGTSNIPEVTGVPTQPQYVCNPNLGYTKFKALYKTTDSPDIWAILETGQRHYITSPESFALYGCSWGEVRTVSRSTLQSYAIANLVRTPNNTTIYHLLNRPDRKWLKINIPSPTVFISYPENYWGNVARINDLDIASYPNVRLIKTADNNNVYLIEGNNKRLIPSETVFTTHNFEWFEVVTLNDLHIESYTDGPALQ